MILRLYRRRNTSVLFLLKAIMMFSFTSIDSSHYFVQCHSYACILQQVRGTFHFLRWDRYTLQIAPFKKYEESIGTGCHNEDSLLRICAPRNAYVFFESLISVIFVSKRLPCHTIAIFWSFASA